MTHFVSTSQAATLVLPHSVSWNITLLSNLNPLLHSMWWTETKKRVINTVKRKESHVWLRRSRWGRCWGRAVPLLHSTPTSARCWWSCRALIDDCIHACALGFLYGMWVSSEWKLISCKDTRVINTEVFFFSVKGKKTLEIVFISSLYCPLSSHNGSCSLSLL